MKSRLLILAIHLSIFFSALGQSSEFDAGAINTMRIENEIKLTVPIEIADQVWDYLKKRYDNENLYLKKLDPAFSTQVAIDSFTDRYYDNEEMQLLKMQYGVRHRSRYVLTDPKNKKNERQLLQIKINGIDSNSLNRAEYKYEIKYNGKPDHPMDLHPFYYNIRRDQRALLSKRLEEYGIDGMSLAPTIRIHQIRKRIYVALQNTAFATFTLDYVTANFNDKTAKLVELELELNEINYTMGDSTTRAKMEAINEDIKGDLLKTFPSIVQDQTPKYNKAFMALGLKDFSYRPLFGMTDESFAFIVLLILAIPTIIHLWKVKKENRQNEVLASNDASDETILITGSSTK